MGTYASLTTQQQTTLASYDRDYLRPILAAFQAVILESNGPAWTQIETSQIAPILGILDGTELIPNATNYANAVAMSVVEFTTMIQLKNAFMASLNSDIAILVKAIGTNA